MSDTGIGEMGGAWILLGGALGGVVAVTAQAARKGKIFGGLQERAVDFEVKATGAAAVRGGSRIDSKVLAGAPMACLVPCC